MTIKYLKPSEVAVILSVSAPTVIAMCARGELPGSIQVGKGKRWRIPETAIESIPTNRPEEKLPPTFDANAVFAKWDSSTKNNKTDKKR